MRILTEEDGNVLHSSHHGLKTFELDILDHVFLVPTVPVLDQPLKQVILSLEGSLVQDWNGVTIVNQGWQLPEVVFCHLKNRW